MTELDFARALGKDAGEILLAGAGRSHAAESTSKRNPSDLVTEFDQRAEKLIVERILNQFPTDTVVAEEGGTAFGTSDRCWLVDPLDGTTNFVHGLPQFCVSVALQVGGDLTLGVVEAPALDWSFYGSRGKGAFLRSRGHHQKLQVSQTTTLEQSLLATGFPYDRQTSDKNNFAEFIALKKRTHGVRRMGSAALDLAMVAAGFFDGYWEMKLKPWDLGAGALLVEEAGGRVTSWSGGEFVVTSGEAVATNGKIHDELLVALAQT